MVIITFGIMVACLHIPGLSTFSITNSKLVFYTNIMYYKIFKISHSSQNYLNIMTS